MQIGVGICLLNCRELADVYWGLLVIGDVCRLVLGYAS